jgi:hypothetical protein
MLFAIILLMYFLLSCFYDKIDNDFICFLCVFFLIKWIIDYRKCTVSYIECKLRGVKKEQGVVYNIMEDILDINKSRYKYLIYIFVLFVFYINFKKLNYPKQ